MDTADWFKAFPALGAVDDPVWQRISTNAVPVSIPAGQIVFQPNDPCQYFMFILDGSVKIYRAGENGRELVLYRVERGELCVLSLTNIMEGSHYNAEGMTETPVRGVRITVDEFDQAMAGSAGFRRFIITTLTHRICVLMKLAHELAFSQLDIRILQALCALARHQRTNTLSITHEQLAREVGSTREVVSRLLKQMEHKGYLRLARGQINVTVPENLMEV